MSSAFCNGICGDSSLKRKGIYGVNSARAGAGTEADAGVVLNMMGNTGGDLRRAFASALLVGGSFAITPASVLARPEGVNRPDLLPKSSGVPLIDTGKFLSKGQEKKAVASIEQLEKKTGFKLRVLCQAYPETPGLAIKEYWGVDDNTIVVVADRGEGFNRRGIPSNIINLNLGSNVEGVLSNQFWNRLVNKLGNQPYIKAAGVDSAVLNTVEAITYCLEAGDCVDVPFTLPPI